MLSPAIKNVLEYKKPYLLDNTSGIKAIYSLRKTKTNQPYPMRLRDDTLDETNATFVGENLDTAGMLAWSQRDLLASIPLGVDSNANGVSDGWSSYTTPGLTSSFTIEDNYQKVNITASTTTGVSGLFKNTTIVEGNVLTISCRYKVAGAVPLKIFVEWRNGASYISQTTVTTGTSETDEMLTSTNLIAPAGANNCTFVMYPMVVISGDTGSVWIKDATLTISNQSIYCTKLYDPANGNDAVQTTAANQPRIVNAGVVDVDANGKPTLYFDGTNDVMTIANSASVDILGQPLMLNGVFTPQNTTDGYILCKNGTDNTENQYAFAWAAGVNSNIYLHLEGTYRHTTAVNSFPNLSQKIYSGTFENGVQKGYANGINSGTDGNYNSTLTSRANMQIGARSNNAGGTAWATFFKGNISEIIISTNPSTRSKIEKSQGKFYGQSVAG